MENTTVCKNCDHQFEGKFCNDCGQPADTRQLTLHYIWHDLQHGLFHFDTGIFYTIKQLLTRPGHTIREFINGKRVRHFKPLSFVVVLATLYALLYHYLIGDLINVQPIHPTENVVSAYQKVTSWTLDHLAYVALILILTTSLASYLVFKKQGYNLAEHLVLNTYYTGLMLIIDFLLLPGLYKLHKSGTEGLMNYAVVSQFLHFALMYWCYAQFFNKLFCVKAFGLTALTYLFVSMINIAVGYLAGWITSIVS